MSRILCVWELGGGYGHIASLRPLALELRDRGHEVVFALKDLSHAETMLAAHGFRLLQAPLWLAMTSNLPPPVSYPEMLYRFGYVDAVRLTGVVRAWRSLYDLVRPDLLLVNHSPTALVAARTTDIPVALVGTGFHIPPRRQPIPGMHWWAPPPRERLEKAEAHVLRVVNSVLTTLGAPPLPSLSELFMARETFLCAWPEMDHYPARDGSAYWGPLMTLESGVPPPWPDGDGARIFGYLSGGYRHLERLLQHLVSMSCRAVLHVPDIPEALARNYAGRQLNFSTSPVRMADACREADVVIGHGGFGTTAASLLAGRPLLLVPMWVEQQMLAMALVRGGYGLADDGVTDRPPHRELLRELLESSKYGDRAAAFAAWYAGFSTARQMQQIASRCEELLAGPVK